MQDFFFDTPFWFFGLLVVAGSALWISGNARQEKKLKNAGYGLFVAAVALFLVSRFVDTDKEVVGKRTRQVVEAVEKKDKAALAKLLHPDATLMGMGKAEIVERAAKAADEYHLKDVRATSVNLTQPRRNEVRADVSVTANVETSGWGGPAPTGWDLLWEKSGGEWLLRDIKPTRFPGGLSFESVIGRLRP